MKSWTLAFLSYPPRHPCSKRKRQGASRGGRAFSRLLAGGALVLFGSAFGAAFVPAQSNVSGEYQVKAAFLFHFAQFVDWPADAFKDGSSPIIYCTIGEDPFRGALEQSLSGKTVGSRALRVEHLKQPQDAQSCQVLFMGVEDKSQKESIEAALKGRPVLTVGDGENFARDGGIIGFCLEDNKVRFEINVEAAEKANLKISAKLLALAKTVIGKPRGS